MATRGEIEVNFFMFYGCFFLLGVRWAKAIEKEVFFGFFSGMKGERGEGKEG